MTRESIAVLRADLAADGRPHAVRWATDPAPGDGGIVCAREGEAVRVQLLERGEVTESGT